MSRVSVVFGGDGDGLVSCGGGSGFMILVRCGDGKR